MPFHRDIVSHSLMPHPSIQITHASPIHPRLAVWSPDFNGKRAAHRAWTEIYDQVYAIPLATFRGLCREWERKHDRKLKRISRDHNCCPVCMQYEANLAFIGDSIARARLSADADAADIISLLEGYRSDATSKHEEHLNTVKKRRAQMIKVMAEATDLDRKLPPGSACLTKPLMFQELVRDRPDTPVQLAVDWFQDYCSVDAILVLNFDAKRALQFPYLLRQTSSLASL